MITNTGSELLLKYIKHVEECEGVDFLNTRSAFLTDDERQHLRLLAIGKAEQAEAPKAPGMAVMGLAGEIVAALLADENDGGYDLEAGLFGPAFSALVRRWANAEWSATQPTASAAGDREGWKEAAIAWTVCASIHEQWAKGKDALYKTRHADFERHADAARTQALSDAPPVVPTNQQISDYLAGLDNIRAALASKPPAGEQT